MIKIDKKEIRKDFAVVSKMIEEDLKNHSDQLVAPTTEEFDHMQILKEIEEDKQRELRKSIELEKVK